MIRAKKSLGQNFLIDINLINQILETVDINNQSILEIGPGTGNLTKIILKKNPKKLIVIEKDNELVLFLEKIFGSKIEIINEDVLKINESLLCKEKLIVFGNLPYNISTQIILMFSNWSHLVGDLHFLVQKEVAEKIAGKIASKNWGKLSIKLSAFFNTEILFDVPPEAFDIKPKVNSSFIRMTPQKKYNIDQHTKDNLYKIIDMSFSSRRKNIKNNLKKLDLDWDVLDINPSLRPEEISLDDYLKISKNLEN